MKVFFCILIYIFLLGNIFAQERVKKYNVTTPMIEVVDSNFYHILDYVLDLDRKCTYFSDSLWYSIMLGEDFYLDEKHVTFQFEGNSNNGTYLEFVDFDIGVLKYGNHYFFIKANALPYDILKLTNNHHLFNGYFEKPSFHIDDSWAMHVISYYNGDYFFIKTANDKIRCK